MTKVGQKGLLSKSILSRRYVDFVHTVDILLCTHRVSFYFLIDLLIFSWCFYDLLLSGGQSIL